MATGILNWHAAQRTRYSYPVATRRVTRRHHVGTARGRQTLCQRPKARAGRIPAGRARRGMLMRLRAVRLVALLCLMHGSEGQTRGTLSAATRGGQRALLRLGRNILAAGRVDAPWRQPSFRGGRDGTQARHRRRVRVHSHLLRLSCACRCGEQRRSCRPRPCAARQRYGRGSRDASHGCP